jgi:hypothetical protein
MNLWQTSEVMQFLVGMYFQLMILHLFFLYILYKGIYSDDKYFSEILLVLPYIIIWNIKRTMKRFILKETFSGLYM